jgi:HlyD family secretion protein
MPARVSLSQISLSQAQANLANSRQTTEKTDAQRALDIETQENLLRLQELNVQTLQDRLDRLKAAMLAPMDGVVTQMAAQAGSSLGVAVPAYQVSDLGALEVNAQVKEVESRKVSVGQQVEITGDGIDETLVVTGRVSRIAATASTARTTVGEETVLEIVVAVDNPSAALRPGLSVTARIITDTRSSVPIIRYAMLTETPEGNPAVFRLENGRAVLTPIQTGITADLDIEVTDGLAGGEVLVLNPPQEMRDGDKVVLREEAGGFFGGFGR